MSISSGRFRYRQAGISLIELVLFIVIVGLAIAGILTVMNTTTRSSADPQLRKQALAIAESMLEEISLMPFTYCDPDDPNAESATSAADCSPGMDQDKDGAVLTGPTPAGESRYSTDSPFDNVADYGGFAMNTDGIYAVNSGGVTPISGLEGYRLQPITITRADLPDVPAGDALQITVTVTDPSGADVSVTGIRTRYAPNMLP